MEILTVENLIILLQKVKSDMLVFIPDEYNVHPATGIRVEPLENGYTKSPLSEMAGQNIVVIE